MAIARRKARGHAPRTDRYLAFDALGYAVGVLCTNPQINVAVHAGFTRALRRAVAMAALDPSLVSSELEAARAAIAAAHDISVEAPTVARPRRKAGEAPMKRCMCKAHQKREIGIECDGETFVYYGTRRIAGPFDQICDAEAWMRRQPVDATCSRPYPTPGIKAPLVLAAPRRGARAQSPRPPSAAGKVERGRARKGSRRADVGSCDPSSATPLQSCEKSTQAPGRSRKRRQTP